MTTQTRFTRGPWRGSENSPMFVEDANGCPIAVTHPHYIAGNKADPGVSCPVLDECEANGVLIAAAPDLYAALEVLADWHEWSLEQSEHAADEFYKETGMLAPFKDVSAASGEPSNMREIRDQRWRKWYSAKNASFIAAARSAIRKARGEE